MSDTINKKYLKYKKKYLKYKKKIEQDGGDDKIINKCLKYKKKCLKYKKMFEQVEQFEQYGGDNTITLLNDINIDIPDELFDDMASWILYSMRELMGLTSVREMIIISLVKSVGMQNVCPIISMTDPERKDDSTVHTLCEMIIHDTTPNKIFIFTGTNLPDTRSNETHYNIFIVNKDKKELLVIDPAIVLNKRTNTVEVGIYTPFLATNTVIPHFSHYSYNCAFISLTNTAQTNSSDVFCQTWTLAILKLYLETQTIPVDIPQSQQDRYGILYTFYMQVLALFPNLQQRLNEMYKENIENTRLKQVLHKLTKEKASKDEKQKQKQINDNFSLINAAKTYMVNMTVEDFTE